MIQKLKSLVTKLTVASLMLVPALTPVAVHAQTTTGPDPTGSLCQGANELQFGGTSECTGTQEAQNTVNELVTTIINIFSVVVGIVAVIMIIFGGFKYITSGGDSGNVSSAKNTILFAIVGLIIVAMAQIIVRFVLARATNQG